jgi:hypothetical protein
MNGFMLCHGIARREIALLKKTVDRLGKEKSVKIFHTLECPVAGFRKI